MRMHNSTGATHAAIAYAEQVRDSARTILDTIEATDGEINLNVAEGLNPQRSLVEGTLAMAAKALEELIGDSFTPVEDISVSPATASLSLSGTNTQQLTVTFTPASPTNQMLLYMSENTAFATVDQDGLVTGVAAGPCTITVRSVDGSFEDTCVVTVGA